MPAPANNPRPLMIGLGELLWDLLPKGKQLGGAPANFAYIAALLGDRSVVASRVGDDRLGQEALWQLESHGLDVSHVQRDARHPTGTAKVELDRKGQPEFHIVENVAWDFMEFSEDWMSLARSTHAVCFGSLAQRSPASRATINSFLCAMPAFAIGIFDVNLRQAYFSGELLRDSVRFAKVLKLNQEEFPRFLDLIGCPLKNAERSDVPAARWLCKEFGLQLVCVTRGPNGSLLVTSTSEDEHPGFRVKIGDTVGAGDAFTATMVHHALRGSPLRVTNAAANRMGAWVASEEGAMPSPDPEILKQVRVAAP